MLSVTLADCARLGRRRSDPLASADRGRSARTPRRAQGKAQSVDQEADSGSQRPFQSAFQVTDGTVAQPCAFGKLRLGQSTRVSVPLQSSPNASAFTDRALPKRPPRLRRGSRPVHGGLGNLRRVFAAGLALFTVGSATCSLSPSLSVLISARVVPGPDAAVIMPLGLTILSSVFPAERRGAMAHTWGGIAGLAMPNSTHRCPSFRLRRRSPLRSSVRQRNCR
jgi:hypothetical protein